MEIASILTLAEIYNTIHQHLDIGHYGRRLLLSGQLCQNTFFHREALIKQILGDSLTSRPPKTPFIDFSQVVGCGYYKDETKRFTLKTKSGVIEYETPYKEIIDYDKNPSSKIVIDPQEGEPVFRLPHQIRKDSEAAWDAFLNDKPATTNDKALRMSSLYKDSGEVFHCQLQEACYFDQIRTNLTLDYPIVNSIHDDSIRIRDLSPNQKLPDLGSSIMANTIGVSGIWVTRNNYKKSWNRSFFLKPRKNGTGVFNSMFGTISGVVEPPRHGISSITSIEDYVAAEMRRELYEESGIPSLIKSGRFNADSIKITLLSFTRELIRGGKPQFFFLIETDHIGESDMRQAFHHSYNGISEFDDSRLKQLSTPLLSPETQVNLLYALQHIQHKRRLPYIDICE